MVEHTGKFGKVINSSAQGLYRNSLVYRTATITSLNKVKSWLTIIKSFSKRFEFVFAHVFFANNDWH